MEKQELYTGETHAKLYSTYRPELPEELVQTILKYLREKIKEDEWTQAVDAGCGAGQSTIILQPYFKKVIGIDISPTQIEEAKKSRSAANIEYFAQPAESLPSPDNSVQLITASTCLHWLDMDAFFAEAKRALVKDGVLATYSTHIDRPHGKDPQQAEQINQLINEMWEGTLKHYSPPEAEIALGKYKNVVFPFKDVQRMPDICQVYECKFEDYMGYVTTLSAFQSLLKQDETKAKQFLADVRKKTLEILKLTEKDHQAPIAMQVDFVLILCRK